MMFASFAMAIGLSAMVIGFSGIGNEVLDIKLMIVGGVLTLFGSLAVMINMLEKNIVGEIIRDVQKEIEGDKE